MIGPLGCGEHARCAKPLRFSDYLAATRPGRPAETDACAPAVTDADRFEPSEVLAAKLPARQEPRPAPEVETITRTRVQHASPVGWFLDLLV